MPSTAAAEPSLHDDAALYLEEVESVDDIDAGTVAPDGGVADQLAAEFEALDTGLPIDANPRQVVPYHQRPPIQAQDDAPDYQPVRAVTRAEANIPFRTAALVLVVCLTAGAATAALVFHDRLSQITATTTASR
jgi:hypothetical protein